MEAFSGLLDEIVGSRRSMEGAEEGCRAMADSGQHPEWHHYEMAQSSHKDHVRTAASRMLAAGWIRVQRRKGIHGAVLDPSGTADALVAAEPLLQTTAIGMRTSLEMHPMDARALARIKREANPPVPLEEPGPDGRCRSDELEGRWHVAVTDLARDGYGWVSPHAEVLTCKLHDHLRVVADTGALHWEFEDLAKAEEACRKAGERLRGAMRANGNIAARRRESGEADKELHDIRAAIVARLYGDGWIRLGMLTQGDDKKLHAQGRAGTLKDRRRLLKGLADWTGADLKPTLPDGTSPLQPGFRTVPGRPFGSRR